MQRPASPVLSEWIQDSEGPEHELERWHRENQLRNDSVTGALKAGNQSSTSLSAGSNPLSFDLQSPPEMLDGESIWDDFQSKPLPMDKRSTTTSSGAGWVQQYGQVTPPDDFSPGLPYSEDAFPTAPLTNGEESANIDFSDIETAEKLVQQQKTEGAGNELHKRKRGNSKNAQIEGASQSTKVSRKRSKHKKPKDSDPKRQEFLARNRLAASKSRQKKKEWTSQLENRCRDLQAERSHLAFFIAGLKEEIILLKTEMLKHSSCGCVGIRNYLSQSANSLSPIVPEELSSPLISDKLAERGSVSSALSEASVNSPGSEHLEMFEPCDLIVKDEDHEMKDQISFDPEKEPDIDALWGESINEDAEEKVD